MVKKELSHLDQNGQARMVDVGQKPVTQRIAIARGEVHMRKATLELIREGALGKGDVLTVAKIAAIQAAKKTSELIPLCHPLELDQVEVDFQLRDDFPGVEITTRVRTHSRTGVEMEALTAAAVGALAIYDMAKAVEKSITISGIRLVEKHGGQSGDVIHE